MINPNQLGRRAFPAGASQWMLVGLRGTPPPSVGLSDGDPVTSWTDSSGNGHTATQTGSARPIFKTNIVNGKPVVRFTSAALSGLNLITPISGATAFTCFIVMKPTSAASDMWAIAGNASGPIGGFEYGAGGAFYFGDRVSLQSFNAAPYNTGFHIFATAMDSTGNGAAQVDQAPVTLVPAVVASPTGNFTTMGYRASTPDYSNGDLAEVILYDNSPTSTDITNLQKYLSVKYAIAVGSGSAVQPDTVSGLRGWWKADSLL